MQLVADYGAPPDVALQVLVMVVLYDRGQISGYPLRGQIWVVLVGPEANLVVILFPGCVIVVVEPEANLVVILLLTFGLLPPAVAGPGFPPDLCLPRLCY